MRIETCFLFDLDGTLVDSVYQHVLAWNQALDAEEISLSVWRCPLRTHRCSSLGAASHAGTGFPAARHAATQAWIAYLASHAAPAMVGATTLHPGRLGTVAM